MASMEEKPMGTTGYLSASELAELVDCKPNQRSRMVTWLSSHKWRFEIGASGLPRVARAYHDKKMGISEEPTRSRYADTPNLSAFS